MAPGSRELCRLVGSCRVLIRSSTPTSPGPGIDVESALMAPAASWSGKRVAVLDEAGSWASLSAAETLAARGARVDLITASSSPLWSVTIYSRMTALERLAKAGVRMRSGLRLVEAEGSSLRFSEAGTGETQNLGSFDRIVHSVVGRAATGFQDALEQAGLPVRAIGDAVAPRNDAAAPADSADAPATADN